MKPVVKLTKKQLNKIWNQPPVDYYQNGVERSILQKKWHLGKLRATLGLMQSYDLKPKKVLDVGCASGWFLNEIAAVYPNAKYYGVDVYEDAVKYGNRTYKQLNLKVSDAHMLPYASKTFDLVVCTEVLEHVIDPDNVLKEIKRVLTDDGIAIIEMDSGNLLFRTIWYWWTNVRHGVWENSHLHLFNTEKLLTVILDSGLRIIKKKTFNYSMAVVFAAVKDNSKKYL